MDKIDSNYFISCLDTYLNDKEETKNSIEQKPKPWENDSEYCKYKNLILKEAKGSDFGEFGEILLRLAKEYDNEELILEAFNNFIIGAKKDDDHSIFMVAQFYEEGLIVEKDINAAARYYEILAFKKNDFDACRILLKLHEDKEIKLQNDKLFDIYNILFNEDKLDKEEVLLKLAECYEKGIGVQKNLDTAFKYYESAADYDNTFAMVKCGTYLLNRNEKCEKTFKYFERATKLGDKNAYYYLGECYSKGIYVSTNATKAFDAYKIAANNGNVDAQYKAGNLADSLKKYKDAIKYLKKFADEGDAEVQYKLGRIYEKGTHDVKNTELALKYYKMALDNGNRSNPLFIYKYYKNFKTIPKTEDEISIMATKIKCSDILMEYIQDDMYFKSVVFKSEFLCSLGLKLLPIKIFKGLAIKCLDKGIPYCNSWYVTKIVDYGSNNIDKIEDYFDTIYILCKAIALANIKESNKYMNILGKLDRIKNNRQINK